MGKIEPKHTRSAIEVAIQELSYIDHYTDSIASNLEKIQESNDELRAWGHEWKELAEAREKEIENLESEIEGLEELLASMKELAETLQAVIKGA